MTYIFSFPLYSAWRGLYGEYNTKEHKKAEGFFFSA